MKQRKQEPYENRVAEVTRRKRGASTKVRVENARGLYRSSYSDWGPFGKNELRYPSVVYSGEAENVCACCGGGADTVTLLRYMRTLGPHDSRTRKHTIPCCAPCKAHQEFSAPMPAGCLIGLLFGVIMFFVIAEAAGDTRALLYRVLILIAGELPLLVWAAKGSQGVNKSNRDWEALMGERCTGAEFCSFKWETKGFIDQIPVDVFCFSNQEYAVRFCELNHGELQ